MPDKNPNKTAEVAFGCLAMPLAHGAVGMEEQDTNARLLNILPAPDLSGQIKTSDGRHFVLPIGGMMMLAEMLNRQDVKVRVDFDHETEPVSKSYNGRTESRGWLRDFRAGADGGLTALADLQPEARSSITNGRFRYLSPTLLYKSKNQEIVAIRSLALTNAPALGSAAHLADQSIQNSIGENVVEDEKAAAKLAEREAALDKRLVEIVSRETILDSGLLSAVTAEIDESVKSGKVLPAEKESLLSVAQNHTGGLVEGVKTLRTMLAARVETTENALLTQKIAREGAPSNPDENAAGFLMANDSNGKKPTDENLAMHNEISALMADKGITYIAALNQLYPR